MARPGCALDAAGHLGHQFGPDLAETGLTVQRDEHVGVAGMEAVLDPEGLIAGHRLGRYGGDQADARRTQDAADFPQWYDWIGPEIDHIDREDPVEACIRRG